MDSVYDTNMCLTRIEGVFTFFTVQRMYKRDGRTPSEFSRNKIECSLLEVLSALVQLCSTYHTYQAACIEF